MGANPVQVEIGEFDEAIEVVEDIFAESKFTLDTGAANSSSNP